MKRKKYIECIESDMLMQIGDKDEDFAAELLHLAEHRERFWKEAGLAQRCPSLYIEGHYEIIKELCSAILALDGWKALNHECLFAYLRKHHPEIDIDVDYLLDLKDTRNAISYRGTKMSAATWKTNELNIALSINALRTYVQSRLASAP